MADFPTSVYSAATLVDNVDSVLAAHQNLPNAEITAVQNYLVEAPTEKTVSAGVLTVDKSRHNIQPQSGTADDIDTISGMPDNSHITLYASDAGTDTLTFKHGTGNISCFGGADIELSEGFVIGFFDGTTVYLAGGGGSASSAKGRVEILSATVPLTLGAPIGGIDGASTPAEGIPYFEFADADLAYRDFYCRLLDYSGGGLTLNFEVLRTSAAAASAYYFQAAIRRINTGTENLGSAHTYDYNSVTITVPAGPPAAGIPMAGTITFTDGADMDSLANGEAFILRLRRDPANGADNAGDTARVLATISIKET